MRVLVVGPSPERSKGGMATVIREIRDDVQLNQRYDIDIHESYVDGSRLKVILYSLLAYIKFCIRGKGYDVYHIHAASRGSTFRKGYYARKAKKWGGRVIFHIHGACYMIFYNELNDRKKKKLLSILNCADMVVALSDEWKQRFDAAFGSNNCVVLENGIDTEVLKTAVCESEKASHSFLMMGRLGHRKGTYDIIDAAEIAVRSVPDIKIYLAGDGEIEKANEIIRAKNLENNIETVGWLDLEKKISLLKKVSTVLLPSYNEGLPMAVLEGMAAGKAIISTAVGAIPEVVSDDNGILIEPGDVQALADAMLKCTQDIEMLKKMSANNIKKIENQFSMRIMHDRLAEYYDIVGNSVDQI